MIVQSEVVEQVVDILVGISDALPDNQAVQQFIYDLLCGIQRLADPPPPPQPPSILGFPIRVSWEFEYDDSYDYENRLRFGWPIFWCSGSFGRPVE